MAQKAIHTIKLTDTLVLSECKDGWWLYDKVVGMNLGMRCKSPDAAFIEALTYYQKRLTVSKERYANLSDKVEKFISQFVTEDEFEID